MHKTHKEGKEQKSCKTEGENGLIFDRCVTECDIRNDFDTNNYPNIFASRKLCEQMSEYICIK